MSTILEQISILEGLEERIVKARKEMENDIKKHQEKIEKLKLEYVNYCKKNFDYDPLDNLKLSNHLKLVMKTRGNE